MRYQTKLLVPAVAVSLLLAACGGGSKTTSSSSHNSAPATNASSETVKTASSSLGTILVNQKGMTLYHLSVEQNGKFICTSSSCTGIWHPLTVSAGATPSGEVGSLGTVKRPDGTTQVTYKGSPLYTFAQDQQPGETNGQGIKDVGTWTVIKASTSSSNTGSAPAAPPSEESKYGY